MTHITFIVTGDMEERSIVDSIGRMFGPAVNLKLSVERADGFTSNVVSSFSPSESGKTTIELLARRLIAEVDPGRKKKHRPDFVIALDDLEVCNMNRAPQVYKAFSEAVHHVMHNNSTYQSQTRIEQQTQRVKQQASFHLMSPMPEAYFLHCKDATTALNAIDPPSSCLQGQDPEAFCITGDAHFLDMSHQPGDYHWATKSRQHNPKRYIERLIAPTAGVKRRHRYKENRQGVAAMTSINWRALLGTQHTNLALQALFEDLTDMLGLPTIPGASHCNLHMPGNVLRNI